MLLSIKSRGGDPYLTGSPNFGGSILGCYKMPTYDMQNIKTGEIKEMFISIAKKEELLASGEWEQKILSPAALVTHTGNIINKTSGDWKDLLKKIKSETSIGESSGLSAAQRRKHGLAENTIKL